MNLINLFQLALVIACVCSLHHLNLVWHVDADDNSSYAYDMRRFGAKLELAFDLSLALFLALAIHANHYALLAVVGAAAVTLVTQFSLLRSGQMRMAALRCFVPLATVGATVMNLDVFGKQLPVLLSAFSLAIAVASFLHASHKLRYRLGARA